MLKAFRCPLPTVNSNVIVIGSGPNGLAAAIALAQVGHAVTVLEAEDQIGGGMRSAELTLPGFVHDICSAVHPMAIASPFFRTLPLHDYGLEWIHPPAPVAHPLDDGSAVMLENSVEATAAGLGPDQDAYINLMAPIMRNWDKLLPELLAPPHFPRNPWSLARFGLRGMCSAERLARSYFRGERARALFAGLAAHAILPLDRPFTAAFGLMFAATAHGAGWPIARGGSQRLADGLAAYLRSLGGEIQTGRRVQALDELPSAPAILCDVTPTQLVMIAGLRLPKWFRKQLRNFHYGPGVFKIDWALDGPIPWRAPECARAGTLHLGGTLEQIAASERAPWEGRLAASSFTLLAQPSLFDPSRAPAGGHTAWAYCHVPNGSIFDLTSRIEAQVERFAPGFRQRIRATSVMSPARLEEHNANLIGGDITGGAQIFSQLFTRPTWRLYATPVRNLFLCSSSTPPGGGVHGMCGYYAAQWALEGLRKANRH